MSENNNEFDLKPTEENNKTDTDNNTITNTEDNEEKGMEFAADSNIETNNGKTKKEKNSVIFSVIDYAEIFVFAIAAVILIFSFIFRLCIVKGPSMENTLFENELLVVSDVAYKPERGDIVVFHQTGSLNEPVVKRVIAVGGETININFDTWTVTITDRDGNTFVHNEPYMYLDPSVPDLLSDYQYPYRVPEGSLFVMGDNRRHSSDSRGFAIGVVDERRLLGKVILRVTPFDKFGKVE